MLFNIFLNMLTIAGMVMLTFGTLIFLSLFLPLKAPADRSNRINRIRILWFAISAPHRFANCEGFTWLKGDERDNLKDTNWTKSE